MKLMRSLAGIPVIVESPSSYRIATTNLEAARLKSWIQFVSPQQGWTITWDERDRGVITSGLRWKSAEAVAEYLIDLGRNAG